MEKQLSEIEKHVVEKRKQTAAAAARAASYSANTSEQYSAQTKTQQPMEAAGAIGAPGQKLVTLTSANVNSSASKEENSTKFGNSMREMLKNVVSSQKNVLYKKVDTIEQQQQNIQDQGAAQAPPQTQQKTKMGKFFQTLSLKNSLSKSSQSVEKSKSKDSLVSNTDSDVSKFVTPKLQQPPVLPDKKLDKKQRSKSLSSENRHRSNSSNRSEVGSSSANTAAGKQSTSGAGSRAEGQVKPQTRWLGKNPFDTSPATEVLSDPSQLNPFMPDYNESYGQFSGISQNDSAATSGLVGPGTHGSQRCFKKEGPTLGKSEIRVENQIIESSNNILET